MRLLHQTNTHTHTTPYRPYRNPFKEDIRPLSHTKILCRLVFLYKTMACWFFVYHMYTRGFCIKYNNNNWFLLHMYIHTYTIPRWIVVSSITLQYVAVATKCVYNFIKITPRFCVPTYFLYLYYVKYKCIWFVKSVATASTTCELWCSLSAIFFLCLLRLCVYIILYR
jgi:hypothetical protein